MPQKCERCKKQATKNRILDATNICNECKKDEVDDNSMETSPNLGDDKAMSDLTIGEFKAWLKCELSNSTRKIVREELQATTKALQDLKKEHNDLKKKVTDMEKRFEEKVKKLEKDVADANEENNKLKVVSNNNLKYLINHDRNRRKHNVMLFGVSENEEMKLGTKTAKSDEDKTELLLDYIGCADSVERVDLFRLGKPRASDSPPRPIKLTFASKENAFLVLSKASKLKGLLDSDELNIYCKPDKSKSEQVEFQRLGKKKSDLLVQYPTPENGNPRVILEKGSLKVDGVEVDKFAPVQSLF